MQQLILGELHGNRALVDRRDHENTKTLNFSAYGEETPNIPDIHLFVNSGKKIGPISWPCHKFAYVCDLRELILSDYEGRSFH